MDPYLQGTVYEHRTRALTGFAARVRAGSFGRGQQVGAGTVLSAITAIGQTISLARGVNPTKLEGSEKLLPRLAQMIEGWKRDDPPVVKKLPVEVDVPELLARLGRKPTANELDRAIGDLSLIAFYYLLRVGEYTVKATRNNSKRTVQFRVADVTFFKKDTNNQLRQLSRTADDATILSADSATLKLDNQKNGWKGVCIHQEANGNHYLCPVRALGRRYTHVRQYDDQMNNYLSTFFHQNTRFDVSDADIRKSIKMAAALLQYTEKRASRSNEWTHIPSKVGAQMRCRYRGTQTDTFKRWAVGEVLHFWSTYEKNLHVSQKG